MALLLAGVGSPDTELGHPWQRLPSPTGGWRRGPRLPLPRSAVPPGHRSLMGAADGRLLPGRAALPTCPCSPSTTEQHCSVPLGTQLRFV